jgi:tRNA/rRNA methyltransferase
VIAKDRAARQAWLEARGYSVINMLVAEIERDLAAQLDRVESGLLERR